MYFLFRDGHATSEQIRREGEAKFLLGDQQVFSYLGFLRLGDSSDVEDWPETLSLVREAGVTRAVVDDYLAGAVQREGGVD